MSAIVRLGWLLTAFVAACASAHPAPAVLEPHDAADFAYTLIRVPGSFEASRTLVERANGAGDIVGRYMAGTTWHGFVRRGGVFEKIDVPGATQTMATGMNDSGEIVGRFTIGTTEHGFRYSGGSYVTVDAPGATDTRLYDVAENGEISGSYRVGGGKYQPAVWIEGTFTALPALTSALGADMAEGFGIDGRGRVVGHLTTAGDTKMYGFVYDPRSAPVKLDYPGSTRGAGAMSCGVGTGRHGEVLGHYSDPVAGGVTGFIWRSGRYIGRLRVPGAAETYPVAITASGIVVGAAILKTGERVGFTAAVR